MKMRLVSNIKKRWKLLLFLLLVLIGVGYWYYGKTHQPKEVFTFIKPSRENLVKTLEISGSINAKEYVHMRFAAGGKVVRLGAQEGEFVERGQTIATIDQRTLQKTLDKSLNTYSKERIDWEQVVDNTKDRALPKNEVISKQKDQLDLTSTVLDVQLNSIAITNTVLAAPFDGILISSPTAVTGVNLLATDTFDLVNPDTLYFQGQVDELDIGTIEPGQKAEISFDAYPDQKIESEVRYIPYKSSQTSTSTVFLVELPIHSDDLNRFRIGLNGDATITLKTKENALTIPLDATIQKDGKTFVKVKKSDTESVEKEIQTGLENDDKVEVLSGLYETDEVLLPD